MRGGPGWCTKHINPYGRIPGFYGADDEQLDVYLAQTHPEDTGSVYRITQNKPDGSFDEHKFMMGFPSSRAAEAAYLVHMPHERFGGIDEMTTDQFKGQYLSDLAKRAIKVSISIVDLSQTKLHPQLLKLTSDKGVMKFWVGTKNLATVASVNGKPIGWAAYNNQDIIVGVFVAEPYRGKGVATRLLTALLANQPKPKCSVAFTARAIPLFVPILETFGWKWLAEYPSGKWRYRHELISAGLPMSKANRWGKMRDLMSEHRAQESMMNPVQTQPDYNDTDRMVTDLQEAVEKHKAEEEQLRETLGDAAEETAALIDTFTGKTAETMLAVGDIVTGPWPQAAGKVLSVSSDGVGVSWTSKNQGYFTYFNTIQQPSELTKYDGTIEQYFKDMKPQKVKVHASKRKIGPGSVVKANSDGDEILIDEDAVDFEGTGVVLRPGSYRGSWIVKWDGQEGEHEFDAADLIPTGEMRPVKGFKKTLSETALKGYTVKDGRGELWQVDDHVPEGGGEEAYYKLTGAGDSNRNMKKAVPYKIFHQTYSVLDDNPVLETRKAAVNSLQQGDNVVFVGDNDGYTGVYVGDKGGYAGVKWDDPSNAGVWTEDGSGVTYEDYKDLKKVAAEEPKVRRWKPSKEFHWGAEGGDDKDQVSDEDSNVWQLLHYGEVNPDNQVELLGISQRVKGQKKLVDVDEYYSKYEPMMDNPHKGSDPREAARYKIAAEEHPADKTKPAEGYWPDIERQFADDLRLTEVSKGTNVWTPNGFGTVEDIWGDGKYTLVRLDASGELKTYNVERLRKKEAIKSGMVKLAEDFPPGTAVQLKPEFGKRGIVLYATPYQDLMVSWSDGRNQRVNPDLLQKAAGKRVTGAILQRLIMAAEEEPEPAPPADNDHVAPGAEPFPEPGAADAADQLEMLNGNPPSTGGPPQINVIVTDPNDIQSVLDILNELDEHDDEASSADAAAVDAAMGGEEVPAPPPGAGLVETTPEEPDLKEVEGVFDSDLGKHPAMNWRFVSFEDLDQDSDIDAPMNGDGLQAHLDAMPSSGDEISYDGQPVGPDTQDLSDTNSPDLSNQIEPAAEPLADMAPPPSVDSLDNMAAELRSRIDSGQEEMDLETRVEQFRENDDALKEVLDELSETVEDLQCQLDQGKESTPESDAVAIEMLVPVQTNMTTGPGMAFVGTKKTANKDTLDVQELVRDVFDPEVDTGTMLSAISQKLSDMGLSGQEKVSALDAARDDLLDLKSRTRVMRPMRQANVFGEKIKPKIAAKPKTVEKKAKELVAGDEIYDSSSGDVALVLGVNPTKWDTVEVSVDHNGYKKKLTFRSNIVIDVMKTPSGLPSKLTASKTAADASTEIAPPEARSANDADQKEVEKDYKEDQDELANLYAGPTVQDEWDPLAGVFDEKKAALNIHAYVKPIGSEWGVYSEEGKLLGKHKTKEDANNQLKAIEVNKHAIILLQKRMAAKTSLGFTYASLLPKLAKGRGGYPAGMKPPSWVPWSLRDLWRYAVERAIEEEGGDAEDPESARAALGDNPYQKVVQMYKAVMTKYAPDAPVSLSPTNDPSRPAAKTPPPGPSQVTMDAVDTAI